MPSTSSDTKRSSHGARYKAGDVIDGKYALVRKAGKGSMGEVWVATHLVLETSVAIKLINPEVLLPVIAERLLREARAAAMLNHPSIVRIFDLGETPHAGPFIVMELLEGESLQERLDRAGPLAPEEALSMLLPIAGAMQAAHHHGIIHRDLKPDNIMLVPTDTGAIRPKLVDFGIAKVAWSEADGTGSLMIGTPDYMSPEQVKAPESLDHRTDIWSFCVLLYEVLSGKTPFVGDTTWALLSTIVDAAPPSLAEGSTVDSALWAILERGLAKDPAERWSSMRELGDALARWLASRGVLEDACGASLRVEWLENTTPDHVKERVSTARLQRSRRGASPLALSSASRETGPGLESPSATLVLHRTRRWRRVAMMGTVLAASVALGMLAVSRLDPSLGLLSASAQRLEQLPVLSSPPGSPAHATPDALPPPTTTTSSLAERRDPVPAPSASASVGLTQIRAQPMAPPARHGLRAPASLHTARPAPDAADPWSEVRPPPPAVTVPSAAPSAPSTAAPAPAASVAPSALPVLDTSSPL